MVSLGGRYTPPLLFLDICLGTFLLRSLIVRLSFRALFVLLLASRATQAESRWPDERKAGPFICHANFSLADHQSLLAELGQLQSALADTLGVAEAKEQMHLFLFSDRQTYEAYLQRYFPGVPQRRALFVKGRGPGMVFAYLNQDFEVDVRHECTHALLHASRKDVPLWLDEGLAEYFEAPANLRVHQNPHLKLVRWSARIGRIPKIEALEVIANLDQMGRGEYRDAWAWVHFMVHGSPTAREVLISYLEDLKTGRPTPSLSSRLRRRIADLDRQFLDHFRGWGS